MWVGTGELEAHTPGIAQDHRTDLEQLPLPAMESEAKAGSPR